MVALVQKEDNTLDDNKWIPSTHQSLQPGDWAGPHPPGLVFHRGHSLSVPAVLWSWAPSLIPGVPARYLQCLTCLASLGGEPSFLSHPDICSNIWQSV